MRLFQMYTHLLYSYICLQCYYADEQELSEIEIFRRYCPGIKTCTNESSEVEAAVTLTCCSPCACDEHCWDRGNCCPDVNHPFKERSVECRETSSEQSYFVIDTCPRHKTSIATVVCGLQRDPRLFMDATYVSDVENQRIFKNQYCAICNNVLEFIPWKVAEIRTEHSQSAECKHTEDELLDDIDKMDTCGIISVRPNLKIHNNSVCVNTRSYLDNLCISSSVKPSLARLYNLCEKYRIPFYDKEHVYRNVFCFLCRMSRLGYTTVTAQCQAHVAKGPLDTRYNDGVVSFSQILNIRGASLRDETERVCKNYEMSVSYQGRCLNLSCAFGYRPENGECVRNIVESSNYVFRLRIEFNSISSNNSNVSNAEIANTYITSAKKLMASLRPCKYVNEKAWRYAGVENMASLLWQIDIYTSFSCQDGDIAYLVEKLRSDELIVIDDLLSNSTSYSLSLLLYESGIINRQKENIDIPTTNVSFKANTIEVNAVTFCNAVVVPENMMENLIVDIKQHIDEKDTLIGQLKKSSVYSMSRQLVCRGVFVDAINILEAYKRSLLPGTIGGHLSLACSLLSILSAGCTVVVNLAFDRTYNLPKYILHMVCINLILAQCLFQFGVGLQGARLLCIIVGALIHYMWLAHALAMSAFVFGVVIKIRNGISNSSVSYARVIYHVMYIYGTPLLFIALNIVVATVKSGNMNTGYGKEGNNELCYISSAIGRVGFFVVPIFVIVGLNTSAYVYFVWFMVRSRIETEVLRTHRSYIQAYARLSSVTGVTWIFGLMAEFITTTPMFEYLFIITNCGQGIIIFLAFGRIRNIYLSIKTRGIVTTAATVE